MPLSTPDPAKMQLLNAALPNVAFDGWSPTTFNAALAATDISVDHGRSLFPRGAIDMAVLFHTEGDRAMAQQLKSENLSVLRFGRYVGRCELVHEACDAVRRLGISRVVLAGRSKRGSRGH